METAREPEYTDATAEIPSRLSEGRGNYVRDPNNTDPMEVERPCCYNEYVGPIKCWEELGMRIRWTVPEIPGGHVGSDATGSDDATIHMLEPVLLKLCLECKKPVPIREVSVNAWTHIFSANNHEGIFREVPLVYDENSRRWDDNGLTCYEFQTHVSPTHTESFRLTFNVKFRDVMLWVSKFQVDNILEVHSVRHDSDVINTVRHKQITKNISIGNNLTFLLVDELPYDAVLNLDNLTEERMPQNVEFKGIRLFKQVNAGGGHEIAEENIIDIVNWLRENNELGKNILITDECGQGRVGSAMTAYIYKNNPNLTFDEAYEYVKKRIPGVYCHKGLRALLTKLYPRD